MLCSPCLGACRTASWLAHNHDSIKSTAAQTRQAATCFSFGIRLTTVQAFFIIIYYLLFICLFPLCFFGDAGSDLTCIQLILLPLRPSSATDSDPREPNFCCRLSEAAYIDHLRSLDTQRSCKTSSSQCSIGVGSRSRRSNQLVS